MPSRKDTLLLQRSLRTIPLLANWPEHALEQVSQFATVRRLAPREAVIAHGELLGGLYAIVAGSIEVSLSHPDGRKQLRLFAGTGRVFGYLSIFSGEGSTHTYVAREPTIVVVIPKAILLKVLEQNPELWLGVVQGMARQQMLTLRSLTSATFEPLRNQLLRVLVMHMAESKKMPGGDAVRIAISQEALGSLLGVSRQAVSKHIKKLESEGLVQVAYRSIVVPDPDALRRATATRANERASARPGKTRRSSTR